MHEAVIKNEGAWTGNIECLDHLSTKPAKPEVIRREEKNANANKQVP